MKDYKSLARVYLKANRSRSLITVIGVAITVIALYGGLNLAYSYLLYNQDLARANTDYEFILLAESREDAESIAADDRIQKAYIGEYVYEEYMSHDEYRQRYGREYEDPYLTEDSLVTVETVLDSALYATSRNPYFMNKTMKELAADYDVEAVLNYELGDYYFQDDSFIIFYVVLVLFVAYIFAIFAVGIIRNTIQMFMLEQMKDYGILRCIGATKKQLGKIIYRMGMYVELVGIACGFVLGGAASRGVGMYMSMSLDTAAELNAGYHILPIVPVVIAYLGDLYFVMGECGKLITGITPTEAVRGEFRFRMEKLKVRGRGLMGRLFGIEGEYARKSVLRNRGRLAKTVFGVSLSIAAFVAVWGTVGIVDTMTEYVDSTVGKYQYVIECIPNIYECDMDFIAANLPDADTLAEMYDYDEVTLAKKLYAANVYVTDSLELFDKYSDEYKQICYSGTADTDVSGNVTYANIELRGLDDEDLSDLSGYLTDGTTDVSENGIVIVTAQTEYDSESDEKVHMDILTYKVGDTIDIVDTELLYSTLLNTEYESYSDVWQQLIEDGHYKTYTVEGIVDMGDAAVCTFEPVAYTSIANYLGETGFSENEISGMKYRLDTERLTEPDRAVRSDSLYNTLVQQTEELGEISLQSCDYVVSLAAVVSTRKFAWAAVLAVAFIFSLSSVNIINTTLGNLHMRRREFAQLRVIGMSRDRLTKTVMLEGVMTIALSNIIGALVGAGAYMGVCGYVNMAVKIGFSPPIPAIVIAFVMSAALICGSIYFPLRRLPRSMAEELILEE